MPLFTRRQLIAACAAGAALLALPFPAWAQTVDQAALLQPGPLGDKVLGAEDAPVTVVEYASMTCPHCASFHNDTFDAFKEKYIDSGQVRFVFREFPLDAGAYGIAMLARCAPADRYFDVVDVYFDKQEEWARSQDVYNAILDIAQQFGFTKESFDACLSNQALFDSLNEVRSRASERFGVNSTPTFFINGEKQSGALTLDQLDAEIQPLL
jgi:protein-disulfide isomerase